MTKWAVAERLDSLPELDELTGGFLYAGRTSLTFFRVDEPTPKVEESRGEDGVDDDTKRVTVPPEQVILEGARLDVSQVDQVLQRMSAAGDPFNEASRPKHVTREPQLVFAIKRDDGSILLTFVVEGPVTHIIHNFAVQPVVVDEFFSAVVYPERGFVEVRTNQTTAARFGRTWMDEFAKSLGLQAFPVSITEDDFEALAKELDAGTARFRGKNTSGGAVDTVEVRMVPGFRTLAGDQNFESKRAGTEQQLGDLIFGDDAGKEYRIRVSRVRGSIFFVRPAPEAVINQVREALRRVKVRHRRS